ncbi:carbohydrate ABC transporter membrane protein 1 (CUT1 family) [Paenibacillus cellulosilyticus]|uniref:Carbohydrate ABC transporter membrane protein 1 (CUT1 family) n=1 Tax=Paenibacillus cellulosilyticus TaxID=375489 RepID=A0A2V2YQU2_9BACL|nr:sugar ABC transporter permease [Paenibacillus cellulosilyticus]PWV99501.1 carbohydrate ABC transporter membrane protein 1 (CUT1 family) [Paenibacillus cellulosilyticus]QKS44754.1 sugar ABC transporter permease [Paenibacillus cellulosilyticus]
MQKYKTYLAGYLFLLPWLIGFVFLCLSPIAASLYLSFTNYDLLTSPKWVGLANYRAMFTDDYRMMDSIKVTFQYVFLSVPLRLVFALVVAVVLNQGIRLLGFYRTIYYIPSLLGGSVAISVLWKQVFGKEGIFNQALAWFGIDGPNWVADPRYAIFSLVGLSVWQFGSVMIIFLAGIKQIPGELYEAATVDGAGVMRKFWRITMPLLTPVIFFNLTITLIQSFQTFTKAFIISNGTGGPINSTLLYSLYLYIKGFSFHEMGYASAMAWVLLVVVALITGIMFLSSRYWVFYSDGRE